MSILSNAANLSSRDSRQFALGSCVAGWKQVCSEPCTLGPRQQGQECGERKLFIFFGPAEVCVT